jgi:hypothetical protein
LQTAIRALRFTLPLEPEDPLYVPRADEFGEHLGSYLLAPSASRVLIAGTPGSGKSTELSRVPRELADGSRTLLCRCDRDLDLLHPSIDALCTLIWNSAHSQLPGAWSERLRESFTETALAMGPAGFKRVFGPLTKDSQRIRQAMGALMAEANATFGRLTVILDGLEKLPTGEIRFIEEILAHPGLRAAQLFMVVPHWRLYGWESLRLAEDTDTVEVGVDPSSAFVQLVLSRRAGSVLPPDILHGLSQYSGGVVRDALQLAVAACRNAMTAGRPQVALEDLTRAAMQQSEFFATLFIDDASTVSRLLEEVRSTHKLPEASGGLRDRLLAAGAILRDRERRFFVHPLAASPQ